MKIESKYVENDSRFRDARYFAMAAHAAVGQDRKYTREYYIVHPVETAGYIQAIGGSVAQVISALLHDVVEDTKINIEMIADIFGDEVAEMVNGLSDIAKPEDGKRSVRMEINRRHSLEQSEKVLDIKLADFISNASSIIQHDPGFARVWMGEKRLLVEAIRASGKEVNPNLLFMAEGIISDFFSQKN